VLSHELDRNIRCRSDRAQNELRQTTLIYLGRSFIKRRPFHPGAAHRESVDFKQLLKMESGAGTTNIRNVKSRHWTRWLVNSSALRSHFAERCGDAVKAIRLG
jgi:hypothetical protein